jgi:signal transduction histidine kinase
MRPESRFLALTGAATTLASALLAGELDDGLLQRLISKTSAAASLDRDAAAWCVFTLAMRDRLLLMAEPAAALRAQLMGLVLSTSADHASLWLVELGEATCVARAGKPVAAGRLRAAARSVVANSRVALAAEIRAEPVERHGVRCGALVYRIRQGGIRQARAYAAEAALAASTILERQAMLDQTFASGEELFKAADRRVAALGFEIHDGPLQRLSFLMGQLTALSRYLETQGDAIDEPAQERLAGLMTLVVELGVELRTISSGVVLRELDLRESLEQEIARFKQSTGIRIDLETAGDLEAMTITMQQSAVARVVEQALANVREHSGATRVRVSVRRSQGRLEFSVSDNGRGFDMARVSRRASRDQRLGLLSMYHRVRLLGGDLEIHSRPGGPTMVSGSIPAVEPLRR